MGIDPAGEGRVALRALTGTAWILASLLSAGTQEAGADAARFDRALAATNGEPDATARARARVEILYRAGDLPGALRECLAGLRLAPGDRTLLWRALELETALRLPDLAGDHARRLRQAVAEGTLDAEARAGWERETARLSAEALEIEEHEANLRSAVHRARGLSLAVLGVAVAAMIALAAGTPEKEPPVPGGSGNGRRAPSG
jgi:hypothetical protein